MYRQSRIWAHVNRFTFCLCSERPTGRAVAEREVSGEVVEDERSEPQILIALIAFSGELFRDGEIVSDTGVVPLEPMQPDE